ncbi:AAA family ATPase [Streptomyces sp. NPDC048278]|uniref:helix-turn-helix transcriptional regulator n=1 Tax=Streptomyces sp. NPDC048278 TaxID=3155809 RepID=UPI0034155251
MQQHSVPLIGRNEEVQEVAGVFRATGPGATRTLLVTGRAGSGKTAVVEQARRAVAAEGGRVLRLDWDAAESPPGPAALADMACGVFAKIHDGRLPVRVTAVRRVQGRTSGRGGDLPLLSVIGEMLADAAHFTPFALLLDSAERMPRPTASALALLLRAFRPAGVPVVIAGRSAPAGFGAGSQLSAVADQVLDLPALSASVVGELLVRRLGRPAEPGLGAAVFRALGPLAGNPEAVLSVLAMLEERDGLLELDGRMCLAEPEGRLRLRTDVAELGRLGWPDALPDAETMETASVLARMLSRTRLWLEDLDCVTQSAGALADSVSRAVDRMAKDRVVAVGRDGRITFAVPALAAALCALPSRLDVRVVHARIVTNVTDRLDVATAGALHPRLSDHVDAAGRLLDDELAVPLLLNAAGKDTRADQPRAVRAYLAALRRLSPGDRRTPDVLRDAALLGLRCADHAGVLALAEPLLACLKAQQGEDRDGLESATRAWALASLYEHRPAPADVEDAAHPYQAVLGRMPAAAPLLAIGGRYGIGPVHPWPEPEGGNVGGSGDPSPSWAELRLLAAAVGGRAGIERARSALPPDALDEAVMDRLRGAAAYGDLAGGLQAVLGDRCVDAGHSTAGRYQGLVRDYLAGQWDDALSAALSIEARGRAEGLGEVCQLARALAAEILSVRGELARARAWLGLIPESVTHPLVARVRLGVGNQSGRVEEAFDEAWHDVKRSRQDGLLAGLDRLLLQIIYFNVTEDGDIRVAQRALEELEDLYEEAPSRMAWEALLVGRGAVLRDADSALSGHRLVLQRGDRYLAVCSAQCVADAGEDPKRWLAEAVRGMGELKAGRGVRARLDRSAQRHNLPVPRSRSASEELSERDIRLIEMVSDGATNRQIAARLACSEKTVEQRLTRVFKRTGRRSRVELAAAWLDGTLARSGLVPDAPPRGAPARSGPEEG